MPTKSQAASTRTQAWAVHALKKKESAQEFKRSAWEEIPFDFKLSFDDKTTTWPGPPDTESEKKT